MIETRETQINKRDLIKIRDGDPGDLNLIYASWLKGLRWGNPHFFFLIEQDAYFQTYHKILESILARPTTRIRTACLVDDPSVVLGYAVYDNTTLHWVFVKKRWRKIKIAKDLVPSNVSVVTHITEVGESLLKKHPGVRFNPFAT